jgi:hypothetical protein
VVAKIGAPGEASYYTRRSSSVETFTVDETAAMLLPLCDGHHSLTAMVDEIGPQNGQSPARVQQTCIAIVAAFLESGVLGLP